ncbi:hypothetical protein D3C86_2256020 [compost metagenome]
MRHVTDHLHRAVQQAFAPARQTGDKTQRQPDAAADAKTDQRAPTADGQVLPQLAAFG